MFRGVDRDLETFNQSGWRIQIDHVKISQPRITTPMTMLRAIVVDGFPTQRNSACVNRLMPACTVYAPPPPPTGAPHSADFDLLNCTPHVAIVFPVQG